MTDCIKCVVVGDNGSGKTGLLLSLTTGCKHITYGEEGPTYTPSVLPDHLLTTSISIGAHKRIDIGLWDTVEQDEYDRLRPLSYLNTDIFLVCYSVVNPWSYTNVYDKWIAEIRHHCPHTPYLLVGLQHDLRTDEEEIRRLKRSKFAPLSYEDGVQLASDVGAVAYMQCSALTRCGVENVFRKAAAVLGYN